MSNAKLKIISDNPAPRSPERAALADTLARRDSMARDIKAARSAWEKSLEHRADAEDRLAKARAGAEQISLDEYIQAVAADDACGQVSKYEIER